MKQHLKVSLILNSVIVILFLFGMITSLAGWQWMGIDGNLTPETHNFLWFFTVDSNILLAVASLILVVLETLIFLGKTKVIPHWVYVFKYVATCATTLTLLTVIFYLSPLLGGNFWKLFLNNNLFFHLISPVLGLVSLILFEKESKFSWKVSLLSLIPMGLYSIFYITNVYTHLNHGEVDPKYDFYYFAANGVGITIVIIIMMFLVTFGSAFLIYFLREKFGSKHHQS